MDGISIASEAAVSCKMIPSYLQRELEACPGIDCGRTHPDYFGAHHIDY